MICAGSEAGGAGIDGMGFMGSKWVCDLFSVRTVSWIVAMHGEASFVHRVCVIPA